MVSRDHLFCSESCVEEHTESGDGPGVASAGVIAQCPGSGAGLQSRVPEGLEQDSSLPLMLQKPRNFLPLRLSVSHIYFLKKG